MINQTQLRVFFSCLSCKAIYHATQKRKPSVEIGRLQKVQEDGAPVVGQPIQFYELDGTAR